APSARKKPARPWNLPKPRTSRWQPKTLPPPAKKRRSSGDKARADYPNSERIRLPDALFHCPLRLSRLRPAVHPVQCGGQPNFHGILRVLSCPEREVLYFQLRFGGGRK